MSQFMALILCWSLLSFSAGAPAVEVGEVFTGDVNTYEGVTMTVVEDTATPDGIRVEVLNTTAKAIESGNTGDFSVQAELGGQWYELETLEDTYANTAEAYMYRTGVPRELDLNWTYFYGSLPAGHYRVIKWFSEYRGPGDATDFLLASEFILE